MSMIPSIWSGHARRWGDVETGWQNADGGSSSSDREGLGRSAPLRNLEASRRTPGRARLRRGARLHGHQPGNALPPHETARNSGGGGGRPEGKFASYVLRRDVLEAFVQRLREDL